MSDRRRVNGPSGSTAPPVYASSLISNITSPAKRTRGPNQLRKIFLKTGLTPSASGSAYLELEPSSASASESKLYADSAPGLKLTCAVHGPRPLPRSAPFSPHLLLSTRIKFAPFAARRRRGYIPDASERDLAAHLETALRGIMISERWPKSGVDVIITVLEGEEDCSWERGEMDKTGPTGGWGMMSVLSGCITVASAAIVDAGIDCVDLVSGGVAAIVRQPSAPMQFVRDPCPSDHEMVAACVVAYLQSRDEVTEIWAKGNIITFSDRKEPDANAFEFLMDQAVEAALAARLVLTEAIKESTELKIRKSQVGQPDKLDSSEKKAP
ncbi:3'-5'-exoribonuclease [Mycoblastus sanguinarius]|nr:3'-5'-exoribonuclease [Mycoblastus sanguinarius]